MSQTKFYLLDSHDAQGTIFVEKTESTCLGIMGVLGLLRGTYEHGGSVQLVPQTKRPRRADFVGGSPSGIYLISDKFKSVLEENDVACWSTYPIDLSSLQGQPITGYHGLTVNGRCGPVHWSQRDRVWIPPPVPQGQGTYGWKGFPFDKDEWDGSDIFVSSDNNTSILVTDRLKSILQQEKITNLELTPTEDFVTSWNRQGEEVVFGKDKPPSG